MTGEIDRDFYCSCLVYDKATQYCHRFNQRCHALCDNYNSKWPTPEQFKEEYGKEWTGAVYGVCESECKYGHMYVCGEWYVYDTQESCARSFGYCERNNGNVTHAVVCACTPWGKPPNDWRPS